MNRPLYKTTIVIWSEYDPFDPAGNYEIDDLAQDAVSGESYCSACQTNRVENPAADDDWDGTEFFDGGEEEEVEGDA